MALEQKENFPKPYVNNTKEDRALMEYVPFEHGDVGNRKSNMKFGVDGSLSIEHVENRKGA